MDLTFLGHQSWLISEDDTHILIDPVLSDKFGYDTIHGIEIYPPRTIDISKIPKIDAIILSHEHSDHFHLPSLLAFKDTPVYIGKLMPSCVTDLLHEAHIKTIEIDFQQPFFIGNLEITFYPRGNGTVFWESRVTQVLVKSLSHVNASVFIAVDALVSSVFKKDITEGNIPQPTAIIVANNSQIPPKGVAGSLDDSHSHSISKNKGLVGLQILSNMLVSYLEGVEDINNIIICGGGFMKSYDTFFGPFEFSNQNDLAAIAQELSTGKNIYGPLPGDIITIDEAVSRLRRADYVHLNAKRLSELKEISKVFKSNPKIIPIKPLLSDFKNKSEFDKAKNTVEKELLTLAKAFMLSPVGERAIDTHEFGHSSCSENRLLMRFLSKDERNNLTYCLNFNTATFFLDNSIDVSSVPFGIEVYLKDFCAVIEGKIQIWDLAGIAMRSWYVGAPLESPIGFLYTWYGEQIQTENNYKCYVNRWSDIFNEVSIGEHVA